jgi:HEAT repeat protein
VHAALAILASALLAAPAPASDAEVRSRVEALLGTIDRAVPAAQWAALGPAAAPALAEIAASETEMPSTRSKALGALAGLDPVRAEPLARALVDAPGAPVTVRETAVRALGRTVPPARLHSALAPVMRSAPEASLRSVAAETLARHAPADGCAGVLDQAALEAPGNRARFERATALCAGR